MTQVRSGRRDPLSPSEQDSHLEFLMMQAEIGSMNLSTPLDTICTLVRARERGDKDAAFACYERDATVVMAPGKTGSGEAVVKGFIDATMPMPLTFTDREIVESGDIALHCSQWTITQTDSAGEANTLSGRTADVLRKQADGSWLIAIDNPWGSAILDRDGNS
jgi:ketosteroid isomerase-like protein